MFSNIFGVVYDLDFVLQKRNTWLEFLHSRVLVEKTIIFKKYFSIANEQWPEM